MKTLALVNQKGGCGKTTTAVNLAGALTARGVRTLLVDLDPQGHATMGLSVAAAGEPTLAHVLMRGTPLARAIRSAPARIALVPADLELAEFEEIAARLLGPEQLLRAALATVADDYDWAILDCPPRADGVLTANALRAADLWVVVVETGAFALQGAVRAIEILKETADGREDDFTLRVVTTLYDRRTRLARELLIGAQARFGELLFDTVIHSSVRLREAAAAGVPVQVLDPTSRAAMDFDALAEELCALEPELGLPRRDLVAHGPLERAAGAAAGAERAWFRAPLGASPRHDARHDEGARAWMA